MTEREIYDGVIIDGTVDFAFVTRTLHERGAGWRVIDNFAVNAYVRPVYTAELDLVVASADLVAVLYDLRSAGFREKSFPGSTRIRRRFGPFLQGAYPLTIRFATNVCCQSFIVRADARLVLGHEVTVAALEDVVQGKLWNLSDSSRRPSERLRDRFDLMRLADEHFDKVVPFLPDELRVIAEADRKRRLENGDNGWGDDDRGEP